MNTRINTSNAPAAIGPYSQAIQTGSKMLFTSGQLGIDTATGEIPAGIEAQAHASLKNLGSILQEAGMDYADVVKTTVFVKNMSDFAKVNEIYAQYFKEPYPARSCVEVAALPKGGLVEIEAVASK